MEYRNFMSKMEDVVWLAYKLKNELGDKISINQIGLYREVLEGKYRLKGHDKGIDFGILYSDKEFLRISVGEIGAYASSYEEKIVVLNDIKTAIGNIIRDGVSLGEPTVFYNIRDEKYKVPHLEYIYADKEETIKAFKDKTIFDDGGIPEEVIVFDFFKKGEEFAVSKTYSYIIPGLPDKYCIGIYAMLENKSDIETMNLKKVLIDNIDELFDSKGRNLFCQYLTNNNDISYITAYVKTALSLAEELELYIVIRKDADDIHYIRYVNNHLVEYKSSNEIFEYNLKTHYTIEKGIKFDTNCVLGASDVIEKGVSMELKKINALRKNDIRDKAKSNNNLLKLVKRMDNR